MVDDTLNRRLALNEKFMNLVSDLLDMALGLYVDEGGQENIAVTRQSWDRFEPFCNAVRSEPARRDRCDQDHLTRARTAQSVCLKVCHAGMVNFCVPVINRDGVRATLIGGEFQVTDGDYQARAAANFSKFVQAFGIDEDEAAQLWLLRSQSRRVSQAAFSRDILPKIRGVAEVFAEYLNAFEEYHREAENLAHNFGTQVRSVLLHVYHLLRILQSMPSVRRDVKDAANEILNSLTALADIVTGYLTSYEDSTVRFKPERIDSLIRRAAATYRAQAADRNIDIKFNLEMSDPPVLIECSREHLLVALRNLVHNAIKYSYSSDSSQDRHRYVEISSWLHDEHCEISVENYGVGIEPDEYEAIFQRGYQGRQTRREYRSGAGRGLPLARHYVCQLHHGDIKVRSECVGDPNDSSRSQPYLTRFTVSLPLKQPGAPQ